jgi:hypothetical protein
MLRRGISIVFLTFIFITTMVSAQDDDIITGSVSPPSGDIEIDWTIEGQEMTWTMRGKTEGWISLGFNPSVAMKDADMAIGWVEGGEGYLLDCYSTGETGPHPPDTELEGTDDMTLVDFSESNGWTSITFSRPLNTGDTSTDRIIDKEGKIIVIWAMGPSDDWRDDHGRGGMRRGTFTVNLETGEVEVKDPSELWPFHAFFMIMALFLMADSIIVVKIFKGKWKKFLLVHKITGALGVVFAILGIVTAIYMISDSGRSHFNSFHALLGIFTIISMLASPAIGQLHFNLIRKTRKLRKVHIILSWIVLGLWLMTIISGLFIAGVLE